MRKIYLSWIILGLFFTACTVDNDTVFDENAVVRVQKVIDNCAQELVKPEFGWRMLYVPNPETHGGYNVLMKFLDSENVRVYTDFVEETTLSTYSFNASQGPVLSFDTYSCLHYLADPKNKPQGKGLQGEFEFVIQSISADSIVFLGKKYSNKLVFTPAEETDWTELMEASRKNIERMAPPKDAPFFRGLMMNQTAINLIYDPDTRSASYTYADDETKEIKTARTAVFGTKEGIAFQPKIKVNGVVLGALKYNEAKDLFESNTPGVIGSLKYSHKPPFQFYNSVRDMQSGSDLVGLAKIGKLEPSMAIMSEIVKMLSNLSFMCEELKNGYPLAVLAGLKQIRIVWQLNYNGTMVGPWLSFFGAENGFAEANCSLDLGMEMEVLRDDQLRFSLIPGRMMSNNDKFWSNMESQITYETFRRFFTDPAGFTIVPAGNNQYYFVNLADSKRWIVLTKE